MKRTHYHIVAKAVVTKDKSGEELCAEIGAAVAAGYGIDDSSGEEA